MLDFFIITIGLIGILLGASILISGKAFIFWRDKIITESDTSQFANRINRWVRGGLFLVIGLWILYIFLLPYFI